MKRRIASVLNVRLSVVQVEKVSDLHKAVIVRRERVDRKEASIGQTRDPNDIFIAFPVGIPDFVSLFSIERPLNRQNLCFERQPQIGSQHDRWHDTGLASHRLVLLLWTQRIDRGVLTRRLVHALWYHGVDRLTKDLLASFFAAPAADVSVASTTAVVR